MAAGGESNGDRRTDSPDSRYLILRPEKAPLLNAFRYLWSGNQVLATSFVDCPDDDDGEGPVPDDHRWVIVASIVLRQLIALLAKPMEWTGIFLEFLLNLVADNGSLTGLLLNMLQGKVVMPERNSETFVSLIGHLDGRVDLYKDAVSMKQTESFPPGDIKMGTRGMMDLCIMASKLAYENAKVIQNIVNHHWKMHFVEFFNGWNDFQKERSTQVYILCDKPQDANLILISFRGTEPFDADDWSTDLDYSWYEIPKLGKVHMGFLEALGLGSRAEVSTFEKHIPLDKFPLMETHSDTSGNMELQSNGLVETDEVSAYYAVRTKLKNLLQEHQNAKFVVTGHSLGGALAILFPAVLLLQNEDEVMKRLLGVYTFGQPRVGDEQLGRFMEAHLNHPVPRYYRLVYCNDLVPRLPYDDKIFLYKHFGNCLYYNGLYVEQCVEEEPNRNYFGLRYLIPEYLNAVWELVRGLAMGHIYGPEYKEGWCSILFRIVGLTIPGISAHCCTNYINSVRLGMERVQMHPILSSSLEHTD